MAVEAAGSQVKLAQSLKVSPVAVHGWVKRGWVPWRRATEIESIFGVPCSKTMDPKLVSMARGS
jgi:DNA-binding transcriptional regulator YdaS (Cro superfamily)